MSIEHAWYLKGWLDAKDAPPRVMAAVQAVIAGLSATRLDVIAAPALAPQFSVADTESASPEQPTEDPTSVPPAAIDAQPESEVPPARKKRNWSPEARAAAAERMSQVRAAKKAKNTPVTSAPAFDSKPFSPVPYEKLVSDHNEYAGRRDPGQELTDADWPDIRRMLAANPDRQKIASDYDVDLDDLNVFIQSCQRREQTPGNGFTPLHGGA